MRIVLVLAQSTMIYAVLSASDLLYDFPEKISTYNVRKDKHTNSEVVRGRLHELGNLHRLPSSFCFNDSIEFINLEIQGLRKRINASLAENSHTTFL